MTPTSYSIRRHAHHPRSWVLEVSNDGSEGSWEVVDSRENNSDLNGKQETRNFEISAAPSEAFRFVRLRQTGRNHERSDYLWISALELFGTLTGGMPRPIAAPGEFPFYEMQPLNGIVAHLAPECDGNVHEKGVVSVTASSFMSGDKPENVIDLESRSEFCSNRSPNSWICYAFGERRVTPTSYSIRSCGHGKGGEHPKSWVLEVSNDGSEDSWVVVDSRENNEDLNSSYVIRNFAISDPVSEAFRFVRLHQTGKNHKGNDYLYLSALELFGAISQT